MPNAELSTLFPLPLTVFERYMLLDDRPEYPMTFPMEFEFQGEVERGALEAALDEALARHPLLSARMEEGGRGGPCFVAGPEDRPRLAWETAGGPLPFPAGEPIDLTREAGSRFWLRQGDGCATLNTQFHHACCDGMGAFRFLGDLFAGYGQRTAGEGPRPEMAPWDLEALRTRDQFAFAPPEPVGLPRILWSTVVETTKWALRRPRPLAVPAASNGALAEPRPYPDLAVHQFDEPQSRALRQQASQCGATVNDLLLRDLFLTMAEWNQEHGAGRKEGWLAINMPQNLRQRSDERMPAANKMGYVFLTRHTRQLDDADTLLQGIRTETELVKQWSAGLFFISGLQWSLKVPGLCRRLMAGNGCFATTVLSNLGDFGRRVPGRFPREGARLLIGNLRLDACRLAPPPRPLTHATLAVFTYANRLNLNLLRGRDFPAPAAQQLLAAYVARVEQSLSENRPP